MASNGSHNSVPAATYWACSWDNQWCNGYSESQSSVPSDMLCNFGWMPSSSTSNPQEGQTYVPVVFSPVGVSWVNAMPSAHSGQQLMSTDQVMPMSSLIPATSSVAPQSFMQEFTAYSDPQVPPCRLDHVPTYTNVLMTPSGNVQKAETEKFVNFTDSEYGSRDDEDAQSECCDRGSCASTRASTLPEKNGSNRQRKRRAAARRRGLPAGGGCDVLDRSMHTALRDQLNCDEDSRAKALTEIRGSLWQFAREAEGCRTVQHAFQVADKRELSDLVRELHEHVKESVPSPHANYVIQTVIERLPIPQLDFILKELAGAGACTSRHRFGCRIICRLLEHAARDPTTSPLVEELVAETGSLSRHVFGHHVVHALLEHGTSEVQMQIVANLHPELTRNAMNRSGSYVIERALLHCQDDVCEDLVNALLAEPIGVKTLGQNQYGCYVVKALLRFRGHQASMAMAQFQSATCQLREFKYGRRLLNDVGITENNV